MGVRADWHEDAVVAPAGSGPFGLPSSTGMTFGPLSLDLTVPDIREKLVKLARRERFLFDQRNLSCPIKDKCDSTCHACPLNQADNREHRKSPLCRVGIEQEQALTMLAVKLDGH